MASPIAHGFFAASLYYLSGRRGFRWLLLAFIVLACIPDADLLIGYMIGDLGALHRKASHSLSFHFLVSCIASLLFLLFARDKKRVFALFVWVLVLLWSHCLIDYFTYDWSEPRGMMLFWPWDHTYYMSPITPLKGLFWGDAFSDYFNWRNFYSVLREIVIFLPIFLAVYYLTAGCDKK